MLFPYNDCRDISGLTVGGDLDLQHNRLTSLPDGISGLTVGGDLDLIYNQVTSLPQGEQIPNLRGELFV